MKKTLIIASLLILICLNWYCTKNDFFIVDNRTNTDIDYNENILDGGKIVNFSPLIYHDNGNSPFRGENIQPFPKGNKAQVFVCIYEGQFIEWPMYQSLSAGTLVPIENPVVVVTGLYDFYFISTNSPEDPPIMRYSIAAPVANGIDYIWYKAHSSIMVNNTDIPVLFTHSTAQIVINVNNLDSPGLAEWINFTMVQVPDTTGIEWSLYDGTLQKTENNGTKTFANSLMKESQVMKSSGLTSTLCVLPLKYSGSISAYLSLKLRGVNTSDSISGYNINLTIPNNEFIPGNSYHYTVNFSNDTIFIGDVNIKPWVVVDLEGNPLYPNIDEI